MATIIIKNTGGTAVDLPDMGISIPAASQRTLTLEFTLDEIDQSDDLYTAVNGSTLIVNNGTSDLSAANGLKHIKTDTEWEIDDTHFTKSQLQTSGQSSVHWGNITNTPPIGSVEWQPPVVCRIEEKSATGPVVPTDGMFYIDTDDNHLYKRITGAWVDQGVPTTNERVINKATQFVCTWDGLAWTDSTALINYAVVCTDDGDGRQSQYVFSGGNTWIKIADVDWGDHGNLMGLVDDDHTQYHTDGRGDTRYFQKTEFINISTGVADADKPIVLDATGKIDVTMLDLTDIAGTLNHHDLAGLSHDDHTQYHTDGRGDTRYYRKNQHISTFSGLANEPILTDATGKIDITLFDMTDISTTLDKAYDGLTGSGAGRIVTVDSGSVKFDASSSTYSPLELTPVATNPITSLSAGQLMVKNNMLYIYDAGRTSPKWLSVEKVSHDFSRAAANGGSQWLRVDNIPTSASGPRVPKDATVIGMAVHTDGNSNATFYLRKNGAAANLASIALAGSSGIDDMTLDVNINDGEWLGVYMTVTSGSVDYPIVTVYYAFR